MIRDTISEFESFDQDETPDEGQPPLSPQGGAESLFLAGLATSKISANEFASKLQHVHVFPESFSRRSLSAASVRSVLTDDFQSCAEFSEDFDDPLTLDSPAATTVVVDINDDNTSTTSFFSAFRKQPPNEQYQMPSKKKSKNTTMDAKPAPTTPTPVNEEGIDAAERIYSKAKDVWAWGKGIPVISIGFGITEAVVGKAVSVAGTDLEKIDAQIKPQLANLDHSVINPAIQAVVGVLLNAVGKSEEVMKPFVIKILSPFGLLKNEPENPELTLTAD